MESSSPVSSTNETKLNPDSTNTMAKTTSTSDSSMSDGRRRMIDYFRKEFQEAIAESMLFIKEWKPEDNPGQQRPQMIDIHNLVTYPFSKKMQNRYGVKFIDLTTFIHTRDGDIDSKDTVFKSELNYVGYCGEDATHDALCDTLEETIDSFFHIFNNSYFCSKCKVVDVKLKNYNPFTNSTNGTISTDIENMVCPKCTFYIEASSLCEERDKLLRECSICYVADIPSVKAGKLTCLGASKHNDFICRACLLKNGGVCPQCREPPLRKTWTRDDEEDPIDLGNTGSDSDDDDEGEDEGDDDNENDGEYEYYDDANQVEPSSTIMEEVD